MARLSWSTTEQRYHRQLEESFPRAVTGAIRSATTRMKNQGRRQMERAGLGTKLPKAFRGTVTGSDGRDLTRTGFDVNPTGTVVSKAIKKTGAGSIDLIDVFETGAVVKAKGGTYLAIPQAAAGGRKAAPIKSFPEGTFRVIPAKGKRGRTRSGGTRAAFVVVNKADGKVWYVLVQSPFTLKKRLNLAALHARISATLQDDIERRHQRSQQRLGVP